MAHSDNSYDLNENDMTVGTDMMVNYLANSEKLRDEDERWYYSKNKNNNDDEVDDDFDSYKKSDNYNSRSEERDDRRDDREVHDDRDDRDDRRSHDNHSEGESRSEKHGSSNDKYIDEEYETLSPLEKRLRRLDLMRKLGELRDLGCKVTNYSIDDDYYMMKYEHELHTSIRNKRNWMGLYNHMLIGGVKLIELGNDRYNPFDFSLKGLSNEVGADKTTYYEILGEIYEHYNVPGKKMNPWFRLAVNLIGTVALVGGKNNAHKFLPQQAKEVENDETMLENLRAKAMNSSQTAQAAKPTQNNLDEYMNKEHDKAAQRVKDLENLKHQELEFQRFQKMLAEDNNKFSNMKKQLEMSQQSPDSERMRRSQASSKSKSISKSASRKKESTESDSRSTMTVTSTQSTQSSVTVNKKLAAQLANKSSIKASSISFGSSNKGKKTSISIGNR
jgi:hypothetical protein